MVPGTGGVLNFSPQRPIAGAVRVKARRYFRYAGYREHPQSKQPETCLPNPRDRIFGESESKEELPNSILNSTRGSRNRRGPYTWGHIETGTYRDGDTKRRGHIETGTQRDGDIERRGHIETGAQRDGDI